MGLGGTHSPFPNCPACPDNAAGNTGAKSPSTYSKRARALQGEAYEGLRFSTEIWFRGSGQNSDLGLQENSIVTTQRLYFYILEYQL